MIKKILSVILFFMLSSLAYAQTITVNTESESKIFFVLLFLYIAMLLFSFLIESTIASYITVLVGVFMSIYFIFNFEQEFLFNMFAVLFFAFNIYLFYKFATEIK